MIDSISIPKKKLKEWHSKLELTLEHAIECKLPDVLQIFSEIDELLCEKCQVLATIGKKCELHE